ncbi:MAG: GNAT family N-acetyltransferase [Phycisphaerales bacterium]|nr:GNAT family N-acetyltransferase [Phycisphaerae bacterium]NNF43942.1 GNAT family N-acetyltransferase [Phycisphaerales bacterium]NNM27514.1 GNAT family N-acetyltransferase [Phycisphaerales bacterium]
MDGAPPEFDLTQLRIRIAEQRDHAAIRELFRQGHLEGAVRLNDTGADIEQLFHAYFSDDGASCFWVACYDDDVIGMIGVQRTREATAEMCRLRVRQGFRRLGVGTALMEEATEFCRRHGYLKVVLDVRVERGPAIALFEKFGFSLARSREIGERKMLDFYYDLYRDPAGK